MVFFLFKVNKITTISLKKFSLYIYLGSAKEADSWLNFNVILVAYCHKKLKKTFVVARKVTAPRPNCEKLLIIGEVINNK